MLAQVLHIHAQLLVLSHLQASLGSETGINEQVLHLLVVNLNHRVRHLELVVLI